MTWVSAVLRCAKRCCGCAWKGWFGLFLGAEFLSRRLPCGVPVR